MTPGELCYLAGSSGATGYMMLSAFDENNGYEMYFPRFVVDGAAGSVPRRLLLER